MFAFVRPSEPPITEEMVAVWPEATSIVPTPSRVICVPPEIVTVPSSNLMPDAIRVPFKVIVYAPVASPPAENTATLPSSQTAVATFPLAAVLQFSELDGLYLFHT